MKRISTVIILIIALVANSISPTNAQEQLRADAVNVFFDPDFPLPAGQTLKSYYEGKKFRFLYREIIPVAVSSDTYFMIAGANSGHPDFYGGVQQYKDGSKYAIFSAWDVNSDGTCWTCLPGTAAPENQVSIWAKGSRNDDKLAAKAVDRAIAAISAGIGSTVNLLDVPAVVIGGGMGERFFSDRQAQFESETAKHLFRKEAPPALLATELGDDGGALGAALLALAGSN